MRDKKEILKSLKEVAEEKCNINKELGEYIKIGTYDDLPEIEKMSVKSEEINIPLDEIFFIQTYTKDITPWKHTLILHEGDKESLIDSNYRTGSFEYIRDYIMGLQDGCQLGERPMRTI